MSAAFVQPGQGEELKATIHAALCGLATLASLYNLLAFVSRREPHLIAHGVLYGVFAAYETTRVHHHLKSWAGR